MDEKKKVILEFIKKQKLAVVSTVDKDKPQSAVLEFGENDDFELIFDTFTISRKYKNLQKNKNASFVIGWDEDITVQYEGIAREVKEEEAERYKKVYWEKNPVAKKWEKEKDITYFVVKPTWIRYSDLNKIPWETYEIEF